MWNILDLKSYFSVYSMYHQAVLLCRQVQPQAESAISATPCGGMLGGLSCCLSSLCSVHSDSTRLRVPSKGNITNGGRTSLRFIRLSLTPIIIGGRSLQRC